MPKGAYRLSDAKPIGSYSLSDISERTPYTGSPTRRPESAEDYAPKYEGRNIGVGSQGFKLGDTARFLGSEILGAGKGLARTGLHALEAAANAGVLPGVTPAGLNPAMRHPAFQKAEDALSYQNTGETVGGGLETAAELAAPVAATVKAAPAVARASASAIGKVAAPFADALDVAAHVPYIGSAFKAPNYAVKALRWAIGKALPAEVEAVEAAAPAAANAAPTLVKTPVRQPIEAAVSEALAETRTPTPPARITTPPAAELPAGYAPRATVPKPKAAKMPAAAQAAKDAAEAPRQRAYFLKSPETMAEETAAVAEMPSTGKRAYFLKPVEQIAAEAEGRAAPAVTPSGSINIEDLPASWKSRAGQDIFPTTGAEGKEILDAFKQQLQERGMTIGEAMALVSKNRDLPTAVRSQLMRALGKVKAR